MVEQGRKTIIFGKLENKSYINKTIKKLELADGTITNDQCKILEEVNTMQNLLEKMSKGTEKRLIQKFPCLNFGDEITLSELSTALKNMKCNKTPGIDGISLQFLKVFWSKMKFFIKNAINTCYKKGTLLASLWQVIITFFPKDNKDRKYIKNWHPISLLSVIYQMASIAIAN